MPKDQTIDDVSPGSHRHDFENIVIWLSNDTTTVLGGAASGHGDYKITKGAVPGGDSPTVEYFATFPTNHELQFTESEGTAYPVSDWDAMPEAAKKALQDTDFGQANPPFKVSYYRLVSAFPSLFPGPSGMRDWAFVPHISPSHPPPRTAPIVKRTVCQWAPLQQPVPLCRQWILEAVKILHTTHVSRNSLTTHQDGSFEDNLSEAALDD